MNLIKVALFVLMMIFFVSCKKDYSVDIEITDFGVYELESGLILRVIDDDGIVVYHLLNKDKQYLIMENSKASKFQNWAIVYGAGKLWFASGDIGSVVWTKGSGGVFEKKEVHKLAPDEQDIPPLIAEFIF
ncbi:hypothetical protein [Flocculibacter collagenilyticus]|uniref:hypothetical protein n=1 Tax=Flocculibacter collagenilyticus TaxID=2744479 RepID=UPI0018F3CF2F|nr:hypothetical protein [Flocculibacter collagenilyticus]